MGRLDLPDKVRDEDRSYPRVTNRRLSDLIWQVAKAERMGEIGINLIELQTILRELQVFRGQ